MPEKPEKWMPPEYYAEKRRKTFRLYCDEHWTQDKRTRLPNLRPISSRTLKPEIKQWLEDSGIKYRIRLGGGGKSKIYFEKEGDAALFKLAWL